jgi:hypothetical protein
LPPIINSNVSINIVLCWNLYISYYLFYNGAYCHYQFPLLLFLNPQQSFNIRFYFDLPPYKIINPFVEPVVLTIMEWYERGHGELLVIFIYYHLNGFYSIFNIHILLFAYCPLSVMPPKIMMYGRKYTIECAYLLPAVFMPVFTMFHIPTPCFISRKYSWSLASTPP